MGIDAWWLSAEESGLTLYLIQAKDTRATRDDLRKLRSGFADVMDPDNVELANRALQENVAEFRERIAPDLTIETHLVSSRLVSKDLRTDGQPLAGLDMPTIEIQGTDYPLTFYVHDVEILAENLRVTPDKPIDAAFSIGQQDFFMLNPNGGLRTVSAAIKANELALHLQQKPSELVP